MSDAVHNIQLLINIPHELAQNWGWFLAFGIGLLVLGVAAVVRSFTATVASMLFFGWLLVGAAGIEIAQAVMVGHWAGFFQHLLAAILFGVAGLLLVTKPLRSAEVLTLFMAAFFLVGGLFQIVVTMALALPGWGWQVADGVITVALGLLVIAEWPISGLWAIGLFLGIDLIFFGFAWIAIAIGLRSL
ncbi:MAG: HdeD family acid-resistance protein [Roseiarcus sp.]